MTPARQPDRSPFEVFRLARRRTGARRLLRSVVVSPAALDRALGRTVAREATPADAPTYLDYSVGGDQIEGLGLLSDAGRESFPDLPDDVSPDSLAPRNPRTLCNLRAPQCADDEPKCAVCRALTVPALSFRNITTHALASARRHPRSHPAA